MTEEDLATNTVIVTSATEDVCSSPLLDDIVNRVQKCVVDTRQIYGTNAVRVVSLPGFKRLLVTSPDLETSREVKSLNVLFPACKFGFSLTDHVIGSNEEFSAGTVKSYLKVPEAQTVFLVSPPASPPPGFDYSRLEEWPNRNTGHEAADVHLDVNTKPSVRTVFDNGHTRILVEGYADTAPDQANLMHHIKTSMPPESTFDDIED
ncbi:unnamed protein product [Kluyveromyces dobzhanskii CBS 2104]|uniref:WGS project CCBQ000000000 data, contig 00058 n=1 Tax=Kluyveromyces dobzhanskii CBS 2104 TaxID=1427455 RepID=A0A0A8LDL6_9SACH|nr:unnamed protein product [Kluyveromyces dobzhanskii CBS 2104]